MYIYILLPKKVSILLNLYKREEDEQALEVVLLKYGTRQKIVLLINSSF